MQREQASQWDGVPMPRRVFALMAVLCAVCMAVLDGVIVNVALPTLSDTLGVTSGESIWIINAYQISIIVSLLPLSALGDVVGYRRVYLFGLALFIIMSVACASAWDFQSLVCFRVVQGLGASAIMSVNISIVRLIYPKKYLGRGIGINSTIVSASSVLGPSIAAAILSVGDWSWLFAINLPFGLLAIVLGYYFLPHNPQLAGDASSFRLRDALLNALAFGSLFAFVTGFSHGFSPLTLVLLAFVALCFGFLFVRSQLGSPLPILPFDLLKIPIFSLSFICSVVVFIAQMSVMVALPFVLSKVYNYSTIEVGVVMTAWPVVNIFSTPFAGFLIEKISAAKLGAVGLLSLTLGLFFLATIGEDPTKYDFAWRLMLCGLGFGLFQTPNNSIIISSAPLNRSGSASGMMATARLAGQISGASLVALLLYITPEDQMHAILYIAPACAAITLLLAIVRLSMPLPESLRR